MQCCPGFESGFASTYVDVDVYAVAHAGCGVTKGLARVTMSWRPGDLDRRMARSAGAKVLPGSACAST